MFDRKSNYALNKRDKNSIIYPISQRHRPHPADPRGLLQ